MSDAGPIRRTWATLALVLLLFLGTPVRAGELSSEEAKWAKESLKRLSANSPRVREGAEAALSKLGLDALPVIVDARAQASGRAERAALKRVALSWGRDRVLRALRKMREGARGSQAKRIDALLADLESVVAPQSATTVTLTPATDLAWAVVPFGAEHALTNHLPAAFRLQRHLVRRDGAALQVDQDGDSRFDVRLEPGEARVLPVGRDGATRPILVYAKLGDWFAAPASLLRGEAGSIPVAVLDADLDGDFGGKADYLRVGSGAFTRQVPGRVVLWGDDLVRAEVRRGDEAWALRVTALARPAKASSDDWRALVELNRFRAEVGLPALLYDEKRSAACRLHATYLATNYKRGGKSMMGGESHDEDANAPGYTPQGAAAGGNSNISTGGLVAAIRGISRTLLHRCRWLCLETEGAGLGQTRRGGGWSVVWTGPGRADGAVPVVVPAPGARNVPRRLADEWPEPEHDPTFYERPRGYGISVTYAPLAYEAPRVQLLMADGATPVPGRIFTPANPITSRFPNNGGSVFFAPLAPLEPGAAYWVVFTASVEGRTVRYVWTFHTAGV